MFANKKKCERSSFRVRGSECGESVNDASIVEKSRDFRNHGLKASDFEFQITSGACLQNGSKSLGGLADTHTRNDLFSANRFRKHAESLRKQR